MTVMYLSVNKCFRCFEQFKLLHELCDSDEAAYIVSILSPSVVNCIFCNCPAKATRSSATADGLCDAAVSVEILTTAAQL